MLGEYDEKLAKYKEKCVCFSALLFRESFLMVLSFYFRLRSHGEIIEDDDEDEDGSGKEDL